MYSPIAATMEATFATPCTLRGYSNQLTCTYSHDVDTNQEITVHNPAGYISATMTRLGENCPTSLGSRTVGPTCSVGYSVSCNEFDTLELTISNTRDNDFGEWKCLIDDAQSNDQLHEYGEN